MTNKYDKLLKSFDGTLESVPPEIEAEVIDLFADAGSIQALEGKHNIPAEIITVVLEQPGLMQKALARRAGEFALRFVNEVLPAAITKAATGESGSIQAAKLVEKILNPAEGRSPGRPTKPETEREPGLEEKLTKLTQATHNPRPSARALLTSRKKKKK